MKQYELAKKRLSQGHELTALMEEAYQQIHEHKRILVCPTIASLMVAVFICGIFSPGHPNSSTGLESQGISCMRCHLSDPAAIIFFGTIFLRGSCFLTLYATLRGRRGTWRHPPSFRVAGVALGGIHHRFAWQVWHLAASTIVSRGRCGTWQHPPSFRVAGVALGRLPPSFRVAGVALADILRRFAWQVRHLATSTIVSRGRGGIHHRFAWPVRHLATSTIVSRGRRGTWRLPPSFRVAGAALGDTHRHFAWQAWHLPTSSVVSRGRSGTWRHPLSFRVAGVAFTIVSRGRCGTWQHPPSFRVAGAALGNIRHRFAWQAWRLGTSTIVSRGRRGTWRLPPSFRVAGAALGNIHHRFAWQVRHLATSTIVSRGRRGTWRLPPSVSRGRRGTWNHPPSFRVAGVALGGIQHRFLRGRRGTRRHPPSFCVAGVALTGWLWLAVVAFSHPGRIKIDELPSGYTMAMHKIQTIGAGICSRCRFMSGCLACDPHKCTSYWMRRESARLGRPIDDEYKKSWGSISCSWAKRPWDSRHEPCSKKNGCIRRMWGQHETNPNNLDKIINTGSLINPGNCIPN